MILACVIFIESLIVNRQASRRRCSRL